MQKNPDGASTQPMKLSLQIVGDRQIDAEDDSISGPSYRGRQRIRRNSMGLAEQFRMVLEELTADAASAGNPGFAQSVHEPPLPFRVVSVHMPRIVTRASISSTPAEISSGVFLMGVHPIWPSTRSKSVQAEGSTICSAKVSILPSVFDQSTAAG